MTTQSQLRIRHRSAFQAESPPTIFSTCNQHPAEADSVILGVSKDSSPAADQQGQGCLGEYAGEIPFRKSRP